jgi:hypothetical protein
MGPLCGSLRSRSTVNEPNGNGERCARAERLRDCRPPTTNVMNSRRLTAAPEAKDGHRNDKAAGKLHPCPLWVKSDMCSQNTMSLFKRTFAAHSACRYANSDIANPIYAKKKRLAAVSRNRSVYQTPGCRCCHPITGTRLVLFPLDTVHRINREFRI